MSPKGVNLQTGSFVHGNKDLQIGDLALTRSWGDQSALFREDMKLFGTTLIANKLNYGWTHNLNQGTRAVTLGTDTVMQVVVGGDLYKFYVYSATSYAPRGHSAAGTYLRRVGDEFRFTDRSGTEYSFMIHSAVGQGTYSYYPNQVLREAVRADGTVLTYTYLPNGKLQEVRSSRGYAIHLDYDGNGNISTACGVNLGTVYWTAATSCSGAILKTSYGYDSGGTLLAGVTDVSGGLTQIQYAGSSISPGPTCITLTNSAICAITNLYASTPPADCWSIRPNQVLQQTTATGEVWRYCFEPSPNTADEPYIVGWPRWSFATMTEPDGLTHFLVYDRGRLVDDHGRSGTFNYKYPGAVIKGTVATTNLTFDYMDTRPGMVTNPEGNVDYYLYNQRGGVMLLMRAPKGGQEPYLTDGQAALPTDIDLRRCCMKVGVIQTIPGSLVIGQAFLPDYGTGGITGCGSGPADSKRCDKPVARIDERGNQTDYTYDPAHGGLLTETAPAVGGVRAQTRYGYGQRYAWIRNASGGYVQSGAPIWVLTSKSFCRTSAAAGNGCSVAGDEVVTSYDYGPDSGPNNLLLRGIAETADASTRRTCYAYDWQGNRISETKPNAGLATCS
jgi:YD repeat-containing protein